MEEVLFEDGTRKSVCTISTKSRTLYELSRRVFARGYGHEEIYKAGLLALDKENKE